MFSNYKKNALLCILVIILLLTLSVCNNKDKSEISPYLNHNDSVKYVGMQTCRQCHADKFEGFTKTGMGLSFDSAHRSKSSGNFVNNKPIYDSYNDLYYFPYFIDDKMYLKEYRLSGKDTVFQRIEQISYIIGSGHHTNSHFTSENGYVFQAPITFYTQQKTWDFPPGFENGNNSRFSRKIGLECITCHNSYPGVNELSDNNYNFMPHGISCERCHGPGEIHVRNIQEGKIVDTSKYIDYSIVNPRKLTWQRQIDLCQRCHLQGNAVLKPNKKFTDFKPGMVLSETFDQFSPEYESGDQFIMGAHAERFQQSKCFTFNLKADGRAVFTCISCHDPHLSVRKTNIQKFNNTCISCHNKSQNQKICTESKLRLDKESNNCVKCHMPKNGTVDIPHVTVHDHYIRIPSKDTINVEKLKIKGLRCVTNKKPDINTSTEAYISYYEKFSPNLIYLNHAKDSAKLLKTDNSEHVTTLIHLYYILQDYNSIIKLAEKSNTNNYWNTYRIAKAFENNNKIEQAKEWYKITLKLQPQNLDFILQYAVLLFKNQQYQAAEEELLKLNKLYSKNAESYAYLGLIMLKQNKLPQASVYFNKSLSLDPDQIFALQNLKTIYQITQNSEGYDNIEKRIKAITERKLRAKNSL